jgi:hypothetical protein
MNPYWASTYREEGSEMKMTTLGIDLAKRRCCIIIVNLLNLLNFKDCDKNRKSLNFLEFSGIMQQRHNS